LQEERQVQRVISVQLIAKVPNPLDAVQFEEAVRQTAQDLFGRDWTAQFDVKTVFTDAAMNEEESWQLPVPDEPPTGPS
jgi:RNase P/RNase MRP subunit POP5